MIRALALLLLASVAASAQVVAPYSETFDSGVPAGWTLDPPSTEGVGWDVDATPALIGGVTASTYPPTAPSAGSLNFNDGVNFEDLTDGTVKGYATSPVIDITGLGGTVQIFWAMAFQVEPGAFTFGVDIMEIYILDDTSTVVATFSVGETGSGADIEQDPNTWNLWVFDASAALAGSTSCQFQVVFGSGDSLFNDYSGWFLDDIRVTCGDSVVPAAPVNVSPPDGAIVSSPVTLDWTDSVDSSDCGPGVILFYLYEVDDDPLFGTVDYTAFVSTSTVTIPGVPIGTWYWRAYALDTGLNLSAPGATTSFIIEPPLAPLAPDTLFVNDSTVGAQFGDPGFVNPVLDKTPAFSAIYRDPSTSDNAIGLQYQVSDDPAFLTLVYDSGPVTIAALPKDTRCPDLALPVGLQGDTVYYWRILFTDSTSLSSGFSSAQSFRIGDDFDFGERVGSSHHGRRCYVATAALGSGSPAVAGLAGFRAGTLERSGAGSVFSRAYATMGAPLAGHAGFALALGVLALVAAAALSRRF